MPEDRETLDFYAREAESYSRWSIAAQKPRLDRFLSGLAPASKILELGCGAGGDCATMMARGFEVIPTDASPEMAAEASRRLARPVLVLPAGELSAIGEFDAVWANACLLHVPLAELGDVIARVARALKPQGRFYASYKAGEAEGRDRFGRYYNYPTAAGLEAIYRQVQWHSVEILEDAGGGYDGQPTAWLHVTAIAP